MIQYQPLARLFTSKGTPRSPGRASEVTSEIHVLMVHLSLADCRLYMDPPNPKLASRESSLHALLQRCRLTRFSQIITGQHDWVSHYQKAISGRDKSRKERVTSIFAWLFITHAEQRKVSSSWMHYNTAAEGHNWPRSQLTPLISTANLETSVHQVSCLHSFILLSRGKSVFVVLRFLFLKCKVTSPRPKGTMGQNRIPQSIP